MKRKEKRGSEKKEGRRSKKEGWEGKEQSERENT